MRLDRIQAAAGRQSGDAADRLQAYYKDTSPLIGYYYAKGKLKATGMADVDSVTGQIEAILSQVDVRSRSRNRFSGRSGRSGS